MERIELVVVGASAGGVEALAKFVQTLPGSLPAAVMVVLHIAPHHSSYLPEILARRGLLPVSHPADGEMVRPGHVYVAPPDLHLAVQDHRMVLEHLPRENGVRPSIDVLFRTAAKEYGPRCAGIILSGMLDDGTAGLYAIKARGGIAIVQEPEDALYPEMPRNALARVGADYILPLSEIGPTVALLAREGAREESKVMPVEVGAELSTEEIKQNIETFEAGQLPKGPTVLVCPECGGTLWELREGELTHYMCHVGHSYSPEALNVAQGEALETALWTAQRSLEDRSTLLLHLAARNREHGREKNAKQFEEQARNVREKAELIRKVLVTPEEVPLAEIEPRAAEAEAVEPEAKAG